jgi:hypothetical protein
MDNPLPIIVFAGVIVLGLLITWWRFQRASGMLREWARERGYELLSYQYCGFWRGPFWFWTSKGQMVYYIQVRQPDGSVRGGYVRLGNWFVGMLADEVEVAWDE